VAHNMLAPLRRWWLDRPILFKGLTTAAIPVIPLVLLSLVYFPTEWQARTLGEELRYSLDLEKHSQELVISIQDVRGEVRRGLVLETAERDEARRRALERVPVAMDRLEAVILEGNPADSDRTRFLRDLVSRKLQNLETTFERTRGPTDEESGPESLEAAQLVREGSRIMDSIRIVLEPYRSRADSVLSATGSPGSGPSSWLPPTLVGAASLLGILGGGLGGLLFSSGIASRIRTVERNTRRLARADGALQPIPPAQDEIGRLARGLERANGVLSERQEALRKSEERFALAMRGTTDGLWDWDLETGEIYYSPRWKELLGHEDHEIAHDFSEFERRLHPDDASRAMSGIQEHLEGESEAYEAEFRLRHRDGSWRWMLSRGWSLRNDDGKVIRLTGSNTDLTFRKTREEELREARKMAEAATRSKSAFLAAMSHELRTPLNAIIGFGELLQDGPAGELNVKQARYVENIVSSGGHLLDLINDVLDLSKVEAGRMDLHLEPLDPGAVLRNSTDIVAAEARRKGLELELDLPDRLPRLVADEGRLKQILYNLLSNAVKFTEPGGRVTLGARPQGGPSVEGTRASRTSATRLHLWVQDTGIGISDEDRLRIFNEFEQVDSTLSRTEKGTGLGLSLVRKLTTLHGGEVTVQSQPGAGSTFSVFLPLDGPERNHGERDEGPTPLATVTPASIPGIERPTGAPRVLVVEDDPWAQQLLTEYLREAGYDTLLARTSEEALVMARSERPDAITLDVLLPGRDGWELLRELKGDPATVRIPVFIVTIVDDEDTGYALGAVACFRKPIERGAFVAALEGVVPVRGPRQLRVLVVDDDPEALELVRHALEGEGHQVLEADGGRVGIERARETLPDVVILDLLMPDVSGFDVADALRSSPITCEIPILVWTAQDLTPRDREWLGSRIQAVAEKRGREALVADLGRLLNHGATEATAR
jgi:PAS domain S-box-containing protein